jgi:hypothetical protein
MLLHDQWLHLVIFRGVLGKGEEKKRKDRYGTLTPNYAMINS